MKKLFLFTGVDHRARAFAIDDVRLLQDADASGKDTTVTLVDGTQFDVVGSVKEILLGTGDQK